MSSTPVSFSRRSIVPLPRTTARLCRFARAYSFCLISSRSAGRSMKGSPRRSSTMCGTPSGRGSRCSIPCATFDTVTRSNSPRSATSAVRRWVCVSTARWSAASGSRRLGLGDSDSDTADLLSLLWIRWRREEKLRTRGLAECRTCRRAPATVEGVLPLALNQGIERMSIGIVGLGYVGLPLAVGFAEAGIDVIGVDVDPGKVAALREGRSHIEDIASDRLGAVLERCAFTTRFVELHEAEAILVCVPTPLTRNREPDLGPLLNASGALAGVIARGQLVVLESTTIPGTTREHLVPLLEESGLRAGEDFSLAFSPERVDPGRTDFTLRNTPKVVGGLTADCTERAVELYGRVCDHVVPVSTPEVAELSKLLENIFRSVNIALVNEMAVLADRMGIDIWEVIDAAATKPFGFTRFDPGPGMGGHCLPVDPFYLTWKAREYDLSTEFIELAGEVNQAMPYFCADKVTAALNGQSKPVRGSRIVLIGVAYKAGVGDLRESPGLKIMRILRQRGADVVFHDDYVGELPEFGLASESLDDALRRADCAVIVTAHPELDIQHVVDEAPLVVDFRGVTRGIESANLVRL